MGYNRRRSNIDDDLLKAIQRNPDEGDLIYIFRLPIDRRLAAAVLAFVVLLAVVFGATLYFLRTPGDHSTLADVMTPTAFVRPTRTPTPEIPPTPTVVATPPVIGITVGATVEVFDTKDGLNIRETASVDAKVVGRVTDGLKLKVLDGPVDQNGYTWWKVEGSGVTGWCVQNYLRPVQ